MTDEIDETDETKIVKRLTRDLVKAAATLSTDEARFLVDSYYQMQQDRQRADSQVRSMKDEPHSTLSWLGEQSGMLERQIQRALHSYAEAQPVGRWMMSVYGIGPVIAAGLLAHIYIGDWCDHCHGHDEDDCKARQKDKKLKLKPHEYTPVVSCPTAGHIWRYAGLDPTVTWNKKQKRPWNASLKTLCWKIGQSFMKFSGQEECVYGHMYRERKEYEIKRNDSGGNKDTAAAILESKKFDKSTEAYKHLMTGKLPPAQIDARARRYAVKMFLSHLHTVWWFIENGELPPKPFMIEHHGHVHYVSIVNSQEVPGLAKALRKGKRA